MKSVVNDAKFTKRFVTGDYQFEEYTLGAVVDERESGVQVLRELKLQVNEAFSAGSGAAAADAAEEQEEKPATKKGKKNAKSKTSASDDKANDDEDSSSEDAESDGESDQDDDAADASDGDDGDDSSDDSSADDADGDDAEEDAEEDAKKAAKAKGPKKFKAKPQVYSRSIEQHKELFSGVLRSVMPDWKKSEKTKALAKEASAAMDGEDFLDAEGNVVPEFEAQVKKLMKVKK